MKRIIELCSKDVPKEVTTEQEYVKLRLRGKGSGNQEGASEPLNIQVSSKYYEKYSNACCHVQELILNVYEEYKAFCAKYKRKPNIDFNLQIKKEETVSRPKPIPESPPNIFG